MKCTISLTQDCNLNCSYCYIKRSSKTMSTRTLKQSIDFIYQQLPTNETAEIKLSGGEPFLELALILQTVNLIEEHPRWDPERIKLSISSNGTIYSPTIADYLRRHNIDLTISCDGYPMIHDRLRRYPSGEGSSHHIEKNIGNYLRFFPGLTINAIYTPGTIRALPETIRYLSGLGVRRIQLTPDFCAVWSDTSASYLQDIYSEVADLHLEWHKQKDPHYINLIDNKLALLEQDGSLNKRTCQREFALSSTGTIYPCEHLIGDDSGEHAIGTLETGLDLDRLLHCSPQEPEKCSECNLAHYCTTRHTRQYANSPQDPHAAFICASEKAAIHAAFRTFQQMKDTDSPILIEYLAEHPTLDSAADLGKKSRNRIFGI